MKEVIVSIFGTGKTIITGAETLREIVFAYKTITEFVNVNKASIKVEPVPMKDAFEYMEGWKITDAVAHLRSVGVTPWV